MNAKKRYLLDTDVLVVSSRIHYDPGFCKAFWDWIEVGFNSGMFFSIDKVKEELSSGQADVLSQWSKRSQLKKFFLSTKAATSKWAEISNWAETKTPAYLPAAKAKFLNVNSADAWLIAHSAHQLNFEIVTNERAEPNSRKDIKLPDAANAQGVKAINLTQLLKKHAHNNFTFKP